MDDTKKVSELKHPSWNPRIIDKFTFDNLVESMRVYGDLSGVVKNVETGNLVAGNQRLEAFMKLSADSLHITQRLSTATAVGTVAHGYIVMPDGEQFSYREVVWPIEKEKQANVAANRIEATWDLDKLAELNYEINQYTNDMKFITGQTEEELSNLMNMVAGAEPEPDQSLKAATLKIKSTDNEALEKLYSELKERGFECELK